MIAGVADRVRTYWQGVSWLEWTGIAALGAMLMLRAWFGIVYALPAPLGDPVLFLAPSISQCQDGFLGSPLVRIGVERPDGMFAWTYHSFVSPALHALLNPGCSIQGFYAVHVAILGITLVSALLVLPRIGLSRLQAIGVAALVFAFQAKLQFRPETLAFPIVLWLEWAAVERRRILQGLLLGVLLWDQPTAFGLYLLYAALARTGDVWPTLRGGGLAFVAAVLAIALVYPFPVMDLIRGLAEQARINASGTGGGHYRYYVRADNLPFWGALFVVVLSLTISRRRALVLLLPFLYWFGPKAAQTVYNMYVPCTLLLIEAVRGSGRRLGMALSAGALVVGVGGQVRMGAIDWLTVRKHGDTFQASRNELLADFANPEIQLGRIPVLAYAIAPEIPIVVSDRGLPSRAAAYAKGANKVVEYGALIAPWDATCAHTRPDPSRSDELRVLGVKVFHSQSGWGLERCEGGPQKH